MNTTENLLARHSIDINQIIIEYVLKFKSSPQKPANFLDLVKDEFQEKIKQAGAKTIDRSLIDGNEILFGDPYGIIVNIKSINSFAFENLKEALKKISK